MMTNPIPKATILKIADLKHEQFLEVTKNIILLHVMKDKEWTDKDEIFRRYVVVLNQL